MHACQIGTTGTAHLAKITHPGLCRDNGESLMANNLFTLFIHFLLLRVVAATIYTLSFGSITAVSDVKVSIFIFIGMGKIVNYE